MPEVVVAQRMLLTRSGVVLGDWRLFNSTLACIGNLVLDIQVDIDRARRHARPQRRRDAPVRPWFSETMSLVTS